MTTIMLKTAVCTLFEKDYHYGVGVLTNSLYNHGFRGVVWAGYRGQIPNWAQSVKQTETYQEFSVGENCVIRFVELTTSRHLAFYKSKFMEDILEYYDPDIDGIFYFDPDIVNKSNWDFYQRWIQKGITLCGDCWYLFPADDPRRLAWLEFAESQGFSCKRQLGYHYNSGFIGVQRQHRNFLLLWQKLMEIGAENKFTNLNDLEDQYYDSYPYFYSDQTYMNLALMLSTEPLSTTGPEGMDFVPGGTIMSHATSPSIKPWRKKIIRSALYGDAPTVTDKLYWQHSTSPIRLYSQSKFQQQKIALLFGSAIGRFIHRPTI